MNGDPFDNFVFCAQDLKTFPFWYIIVMQMYPKTEWQAGQKLLKRFFVMVLYSTWLGHSVTNLRTQRVTKLQYLEMSLPLNQKKLQKTFGPSLTCFARLSANYRSIMTVAILKLS